MWTDVRSFSSKPCNVSVYVNFQILAIVPCVLAVYTPARFDQEITPVNSPTRQIFPSQFETYVSCLLDFHAVEAERAFDPGFKTIHDMLGLVTLFGVFDVFIAVRTVHVPCQRFDRLWILYAGEFLS
jgi:hypothetical protein